jgi:hypothetical protein
MRSFDELQRLWEEAPAPPVGRGTVRGFCVRKGDGVHESPDRVEITRDDGIVGDRWTLDDDPERLSQLTLINATVSELVAHDHRPYYDTGDNFHVDLDLSDAALPVGTRLRIGSAVVRITPEPHTGCKLFVARFGQDAMRWVNGKDRRGLHLRGIHCELLEPGAVEAGDDIVVISD